MKRSLATLTILVAIALLSGCESHGLGPAAISREGHDLLLVVCEPLTARSVYGELETVKAGHDWAPFLDVAGEASLESGVPITSELLPAGLAGTWKTVDFETLGAISILIEGKDGSDSFQATFSGGSPLEVPSDGWLQTDGEVTDAPCPDPAAD